MKIELFDFDGICWTGEPKAYSNAIGWILEMMEADHEDIPEHDREEAVDDYLERKDTIPVFTRGGMYAGQIEKGRRWCLV